MYKLHSKIANGSYILICPYGENRDPHFLNLQDSTLPPCIYHVYTHAKQRNGGGERSIREKVREATVY
jgi:hypothetical protein